MIDTVETRAWVLVRRPEGEVTSDDLEYVTRPLRALGDKELLIRNIYLSLDPSNRIWMSDAEQYLPPVQVGDVMRGLAIGMVEESTSDKFKKGDLVSPPFSGWETHTVTSARAIRVIRPIAGIPLTAYASVLGPTGLTAYLGLTQIGRPQEGETLVVSAAAGAVGSIAGQIGKIKGCRVIGIAGSTEKCAWLRDDLGFDGVINYKTEDVPAALDRLCPEGIDINYENVGGAIMEAVYERLNTFGRMVVCGLISTYNSPGPVVGPGDFNRMLMRRLSMQGFIASDYLKEIPQALTDLTTWVAEGRIKWKTHVVQGLENAVEASNLLFSGGNDGKLLVQASEYEETA